MSGVLVSRSRHTGSISLDRPKALNALTLEMVREFARALDAFGADPEICAVIVTGEGDRAFCAGGDIRALYELRHEDRTHYKTFWREEYELNARIASFPRHYVAVMDGVVMGGGVGLSAHGNCRIVTERTRLAMPETAIGFAPDVGGTWLLTRGGGAGIHMALTGEAVGADDAIFLGLADFLVSSSDIPELLRLIRNIESKDELLPLVAHFAKPRGVGPLAQNATLLDATMSAAMSKGRVEDILSALRAEGSDFAREAANVIAKRSPTSLKLTLELLKRAARADRLEACLVNEYRAACILLETHDLYEGIRAAVVDKDRDPHWSPCTLDAVDEFRLRAMLEERRADEPIFRPWA